MAEKRPFERVYVSEGLMIDVRFQAGFVIVIMSNNLNKICAQSTPIHQ
ncbi:hypothetical protein HMPREF9370_0438 [Neisseria wadsworthii 9715]|uniref:Uncharacterized protein n=1 Tax=Neisseria wadsworthii 9715 TaxID=1030841 RepID=G4CMX9_9NEIS|nr:hypothetical protein HMPREF9370_0438 [Neisseria wadsworthii 9715]